MSGRAIAERWLASKLAGITYDGKSVKLTRHPAPQTSQFPYPHITIASISAVDLYQIGNQDSYERLQFSIRVWDEGRDSTRVNAVAREVHKRINQVAPEFYEDGNVVSCFRVGAIIPDTYEENGEFYIADGGLYQLHVVVYSEE